MALTDAQVVILFTTILLAINYNWGRLSKNKIQKSDLGVVLFKRLRTTDLDPLHQKLPHLHIYLNKYKFIVIYYVDCF